MQEHLFTSADSVVHFVFGVRYTKDIFYTDILDTWKNIYPNFSYEIYLSQEDCPDTNRGYVTSVLTTEKIARGEEFYICGSPAMVRDAREILTGGGIEKLSIFFEQY